MKLFSVCAFLLIPFGFQQAIDIPDPKQWCPNCQNELPPANAIKTFLTLGEEFLGMNKTCGDKICNTALFETCASCPEDCGECIFNKPILSCVNKDQITLTFDDGPTSYMSQILDSLEKMNVNATFFINGLNVMQNVSMNNMTMNTTNWTNSSMADLIRKAFKAGHVIGTHTYSHIGLVNGTTGTNLPSELGYVPLDTLRMQLIVNDLVVYDMIGKYPQVFRPPYFQVNQTVLHVVESMGYIPVSGNVDSVDYFAGSVQDILGNITQGVDRNRNASGIIVVQHDGHNVTASSLETVITYLREMNLTIVDLPTCLNMSVDSLYRSDFLFNKSTSYPTLNHTLQFINITSLLPSISTSLGEATSTQVSSTTTTTFATTSITTNTTTTATETATATTSTQSNSKETHQTHSSAASVFNWKLSVLQILTAVLFCDLIL